MADWLKFTHLHEFSSFQLSFCSSMVSFQLNYDSLHLIMKQHSLIHLLLLLAYLVSFLPFFEQQVVNLEGIEVNEWVKKQREEYFSLIQEQTINQDSFGSLEQHFLEYLGVELLFVNQEAVLVRDFSFSNQEQHQVASILELHLALREEVETFSIVI